MKVLLAGITSLLLLTGAGFTQLEAKSDPIVGVWLQNQRVTQAPDIVMAAQAIFNEDGTVSRNIDANLQRVFGGPLFPEGTVFSISDDYSVWERTSKHCYKCVGTQVLLTKNEEGLFEPLARAKCTIKIKLCGDTMTAHETLEFYDYYDLTLTVPFNALPTLTFAIEGKKL